MANFDSGGEDKRTFAPFLLDNQLESEWKDVRLSFNEWDWLHQTYGESIGEYYLNGYGVQGLVIACRSQAGLEIEAEGIDYNSESGTCYIHFSSLDEAIKTAQLAAEMMKNPAKLAAMVKVARKNDFDDF